MNHKTVLRLMQKLGIRSVARKHKFQTRAEAIARLHYYPNQLNRNFSATRPNQKWLTDVTYIHTDQGVVYLSVIKDLYDGFIVAYHTSSQNSVALVTTTSDSHSKNTLFMPDSVFTAIRGVSTVPMTIL